MLSEMNEAFSFYGQGIQGSEFRFFQILLDSSRNYENGSADKCHLCFQLPKMKNSVEENYE